MPGDNMIRLITSGSLLLAIGCGGGGTGPGPGSFAMTKAGPSGDGQSGPVSTVLPQPLRVLITQEGNPAAGRTVTWQTLAPGVSLNPATTTTGADGIASTIVTLPPFAATNSVTATSNGATGSPQAFQAVSTGATTQVTVSVINDAFLPAEFELKSGGTVTFTWATGARSHNVNPDPARTIPASPGLPGTRDAPFGFDVVFPATGTFRFFCSAHGALTSGMHGTVTVVP